VTYKGYEAKVELDEQAGVFHGEVNTRDVITFQGPSVKELKQAFEDSVDDCRNSAPLVEKTRKSRGIQRTVRSDRTNPVCRQGQPARYDLLSR
jgi:predicted HicB family RNase H-like nuclease